MPGLLQHSDSLLVQQYKKAGSLARSKMLEQAVQKAKNFTGWWNNDEGKAAIRNEMVEVFQLVNYASHVQRIETQEYFDVAFDPATQQSYLGKIFSKDSSNLDVFDNLTPPDVQFPYDNWGNDNLSEAFTNCEKSQKELLALAEQAKFKDDELRAQYIVAIKKAEITFKQMGERHPEFQESLEGVLKLIKQSSQIELHAMMIKNSVYNLTAMDEKDPRVTKVMREASKLAPNSLKVTNEKDLARTENLAILALIMTRTADLLNGKYPPQKYETLLNSVYGHATSSPEMQELCNTMLKLCATAIVIGLVAAAAPITLGAAAVVPAMATAATSATAATMFAAGATYSFFASDEETPQTGLSLAMATLLNTKKEANAAAIASAKRRTEDSDAAAQFEEQRFQF